MRHDEFMRERSRRLRRDETGAEARVWDMLRDRRLGGLKFRRQHVIGGYVVDFVCLAAKVVIEIDGATHEDADADARRTAELERAGYTVVRFSNSYVYEPETQILDEILDAIRCSELPAHEKARLDGERLFRTPLTAG